jgi:protoporphyrinogen oxidase
MRNGTGAAQNSQPEMLVNDSSAAEAFDVIVLGAGISGLVSASLLQKQGYRRIVVVDEYAHIGGNHIDCRIGDYTFDIGSLIFQNDSPLLAHLPELLPLYIEINPSWGRLNPQGVVTDYPISVKDDIFAAGPVEWTRMALSVLFARIFRSRLRNARDFAEYWIGARLLRRSGLENYMLRFYGVSAEQIDLQFAQKRILWLKDQASPRNAFRRLLRTPEKLATNKQLARPREGFAYLYRVATQRLAQGGVTFRLGAKMDRLQKRDGGFLLQIGDRSVSAQRVISTIPLEHARSLCEIPLASNLPSVTLISLFFSFSGGRGFGQSILYNFSDKGLWKRLTMYSDFYGRCGGREYFGVEVNADHVLGSVEAAAEDFRRHSSENGLFNGDLKLEGGHILANAYPVYTNNAAERAASIVDALRAFGVESFGRQGGFDYQPTARYSTVVVEAAIGSVSPNPLD